MGTKVLTAGIRVAVDFAKEVNEAAEKRADANPDGPAVKFAQVRYLDIGGGLPAVSSGALYDSYGDL